MYNFTLDNKLNPIISKPATDEADINMIRDESFSKLKQIYGQIPNASCDRCGSCCNGTKAGNPGVYSVEYLNILSLLNQPSNKLGKLRIYGAAMMYKNLLKKKRTEESLNKSSSVILNCPVLDLETNLCLIYDYRPFVCRVYGLQRWLHESSGWVASGEKISCSKVQISENNYILRWNNGVLASLHEQLKQFTPYYYSVKDNSTGFKYKTMIDWLTIMDE